MFDNDPPVKLAQLDRFKERVKERFDNIVVSNAFAIIRVNDVSILSGNASDTLVLEAGDNVTLTPNVLTKKITLSATDTIYTHPASGVTAGTYKSITVDANGHVTAGSNPTTLAGYGITDAATSTQGGKADTAVQSVKIGTTEYKSGTDVVLPAYPTSLPASNTTDTYSSTGTAPVSGKAVASAIGTLSVTGAANIGAGKTISAWSETDGKVSISTQDISITKSQVSDFPTLGTASAKDVATSGNASASQVVMGNDTRLTDSRNASDVYSWAKAATKPTYTASEVGAIATTSKGAASGVAELDSNGLVPASQLPSYVDDVLEGTAQGTSETGAGTYSATGFILSGQSSVCTPESGKTYVDTTTNIQYRWTGTIFVSMGSNIVLGETSSTAYRGDRGKTAYDHSQSAHAPSNAQANVQSDWNATSGDAFIKNKPSSLPASDVYAWAKAATKPTYTASEVGLGNVGNFKAVSTVASQGLTDTEKSNARANIGAGTSSFSGSYTDLSNKPSIPTKVSDLTNDSGFTTNTGTITGITMNGASKGTSGVVDLGTVLTSHQDISGKAEKSATVSTVAWDSTNKKLTKTINGTTTDIVTGASILDGLTKAQVTTALGYTPPTTDTNTWRPVGTGATDAAAGNHTHSTSIATSTGTNQLTLAFGTKYAISAGGTSYVFTMPSNPNTNTTYTVATGDSNGQIKVTPSGGTAYNVDVKGLGSAAYTASTAYAAASHSHNYAGSSSAGGAANSLSGFVISTTSSIGIDTSDANQAIGYVGSLTKAAWNYQQTDGALYKQSYSSSWIHQIFGDYRTGQISVRGKNNGSWQSWRRVLDESNFSSIITASSIGAAAASHGNHVPTTQTANNAVFLRNDNTWQTVTPANIGAAAASHGNHVPAIQTADNAVFLRNDNTWQTVTPANIGAATSGHTHTLSIATDTGTSSITLAHGGKYKLTAGGSTYIFTMPSDNNTTYSAGTGISLSGTTFSNSGVRSIATGSTNGTISVNTNGTSAEVAVKGLGSAAYTASTAYAAASHTHTLSLATDSGTNQLTLAFGTKYKLTAGGSSYIFTMPANPNTNTTYTVATGDSNGQIKVTPSGGTAYNVDVKGLGSAAYTASTNYLSVSGGTMVTGSIITPKSDDYGIIPDTDNYGQIGSSAKKFYRGYFNKIYKNGTEIDSLYMSKASPTGTGTVAIGASVSATGTNSQAFGANTTASGNYSHTEGNYTTASGAYSHAEGYHTSATGSTSHAEGNYTTASVYGHAEGSYTYASGASTCSAHAEGYYAKATSGGAHAEGLYTTASGQGSHAEGNYTKASGGYSHAEGSGTNTSIITLASGTYSHAGGYATTASNDCSFAIGHKNASMTTGGSTSNSTGTAFVIGNGTNPTTTAAGTNAFSVTFAGVVKAKSTITASTTADYAEFFEWIDGNVENEDRVGYFVTLDGNMIKKASSNDQYILGIVSGEPFVLGNGDCDVWNGIHLRDEFRRIIYEPAPVIECIIDEETGEEIYTEKTDGQGNIVYLGTRPVLNPEYDETQQYVNRSDRPEWDAVGMLGVLAVRQDGTLQVNGFATVNDDGIATTCDINHVNSYRVIKVISEHVAEVIFR